MGELQEKYREIVEEKKKVHGDEPKAVETANRPTVLEKSIVVAKDDMPMAAIEAGRRKRTRYVPRHHCLIVPS